MALEIYKSYILAGLLERELAPPIYVAKRWLKMVRLKFGMFLKMWLRVVLFF